MTSDIDNVWYYTVKTDTHIINVTPIRHSGYLLLGDSKTNEADIKDTNRNEDYK